MGILVVGAGMLGLFAVLVLRQSQRPWAATSPPQEAEVEPQPTWTLPGMYRGLEELIHDAGTMEPGGPTPYLVAEEALAIQRVQELSGTEGWLDQLVRRTTLGDMHRFVDGTDEGVPPVAREDIIWAVAWDQGRRLARRELDGGAPIAAAAFENEDAYGSALQGRIGIMFVDEFGNWHQGYTLDVFDEHGDPWIEAADWREVVAAGLPDTREP